MVPLLNPDRADAHPTVSGADVLGQSLKSSHGDGSSEPCISSSGVAEMPSVFPLGNTRECSSFF